MPAWMGQPHPWKPLPLVRWTWITWELVLSRRSWRECVADETDGGVDGRGDPREAAIASGVEEGVRFVTRGDARIPGSVGHLLGTAGLLLCGEALDQLHPVRNDPARLAKAVGEVGVARPAKCHSFCR